MQTREAQDIRVDSGLPISRVDYLWTWTCHVPGPCPKAPFSSKPPKPLLLQSFLRLHRCSGEQWGLSGSDQSGTDSFHADVHHTSGRT